MLGLIQIHLFLIKESPPSSLCHIWRLGLRCHLLIFCRRRKL